jgi:hypothetical protein
MLTFIPRLFLNVVRHRVKALETLASGRPTPRSGPTRKAVSEARETLGETIMKPTTPALSVLIERFFNERLIQQKRVSPYTIASYRDALRLLFKFAVD